MAIIPAEEKVFMVNKSTNTTYSGSAALKAMQQWYTMQDITDSVLPYKSYVALLQIANGEVVLISELENSISETATLSLGGAGIEINFGNSNVVANKLIGFCYSGGDAEDSIQSWLVNFLSSSAVRLVDPGTPQPLYNLIRVDIKVYN